MTSFRAMPWKKEPSSPQELRTGIKFYAKSLCGKPHGARSAGWAHSREWAITCPRCMKLADPFNQRDEAEVLPDPVSAELNAARE